ncbi:hypothetical protein HY639_05435 [Candidatus Woesearchaeota archaeon]|nr:hypothetical protein [Candidatus Woesearchaeota archaeon]
MANPIKSASSYIFANPFQEQALFGVPFLILAAIIHFTDALMMFDRISNAFLFGFLYSFMFLVTTMGTLISPAVAREQRLPLIITYAGLSAFSFFIPFIKGLFFPWIPGEITLLTDLFIATVPAWVIFLYFTPWSTRNTKLVCMAYFLFWFLFFGIHWLSAIPSIDLSSLEIGGIVIQPELIDGYRAIRTALESTADSIVLLSNRLKEVPKDIQRAWERQLKVAAGDYYIGTVDQNADKPLGVFLERFKPDEKFFYLGEEGKAAPVPISVAGSIRGQSLDLENCEEYDLTGSLIQIPQLPGQTGRLYGNRDACLEQQTLYLSCNVHGKKITGTIKPETLNLYDIEGSGEGVDCTIDPSAFPQTEELLKRLLPQPEIVDVAAQFPFTTKAYLKTYFMDEKRKREMRRANIDIFTFYKLPSQRPVAVYTGGPVMIGVGIEQDLPLAVGQEGEQRSTRFGITLENRWKGEVENITELRITPPQHIELVCPAYFEQDGNDWVLTEKSMQRLSSIKTLQTFNCRIKVMEGGAAALLENFPIVESYFKITARYRYKLAAQVPIKLKAGDGIKSDMGDCITFCNDPDGCYCTQDCEKRLSDVPRGKNCNGETPKPAPKQNITATKETADKTPETTAKPVTKADCGSRIRQCEDYSQTECYEDLCRFNCKYEMPGLLTEGKCVKDTESVLKETNCPQIKKCADYTGLKPSVCEENLCKLRPGNCYYNYGHDACADCPTTATCNFYDSSESCSKDACHIGCMWDLTSWPPGCKSSLA